MTKQAFNPYLPSWEYIPDGEPYVFGDRLYVYGSHDRYNGSVFCMEDYVCWSAPVSDLSDFRCEGIIYKKKQDPLNTDGRMNLFAPDVTKGPDGRYYLYYVLDKVDIVSVAVCDTPAGKYEFLGYVHYPDGTRLGEKEGDEAQFDPGVLTEGDITYLYTGFCYADNAQRHGAMVTVLDKDMLTVTEAPRFVLPSAPYAKGSGFEGHEFFEAPSIRRRGEYYYLIYSSVNGHELCYAMSRFPDRDFAYGGVIVSNCDLGIDSYKPADKPMYYGANNHGSFTGINGRYYMFYHRHTNGTWFSRQGMAEPIDFAEDGKIPQVEMTSCGLNDRILRGVGKYPAYIACNLFTERDRWEVCLSDDHPRIVQDYEEGSDKPVSFIVNMKDGATAGYKYFDMKDVVSVRVVTMGYTHNGRIEVRTEWDGPAAGTIDIEDTNVWTGYGASVNIPDGVHAIYLTYRGTGTCMLHSFELIKRP